MIGNQITKLLRFFNVYILSWYIIMLSHTLKNWFWVDHSCHNDTDKNHSTLLPSLTDATQLKWICHYGYEQFSKMFQVMFKSKSLIDKSISIYSISSTFNNQKLNYYQFFFRCTVCEKRFSRSDHLAKHLVSKRSKHLINSLFDLVENNEFTKNFDKIPKY